MSRPRLSILALACTLAACDGGTGEPTSPATPAPAAPAAPAAPTNTPIAPPAPTPPADAVAPIAAQSITDRYDCGGTTVDARFENGNTVLTLDGAEVVLTPTEAASGSRYLGVRADGELVDFWTKGASALLKVGATARPECQRAMPATAPSMVSGAPFRARGNEPFWLLEYVNGSLSWHSPDEPDVVLWDSPSRTDRADGLDLSARLGSRNLQLSAVNGLCRDSMSGMPYPQNVTLTVDGQRLSGCGGEAMALLSAHEWTATTIRGKATTGRAPTLQFMDGARVAGGGSCNRWNASVNLTGEGLSFGQAATTMMACPPDQMAQEKAFLEALASVTRHDFDDRGALLLIAGYETALVAMPAQSGTLPSTPK